MCSLIACPPSVSKRLSYDPCVTYLLAHAHGNLVRFVTEDELRSLVVEKLDLSASGSLWSHLFLRTKSLSGLRLKVV